MSAMSSEPATLCGMKTVWVAVDVGEMDEASGQWGPSCGKTEGNAPVHVHVYAQGLLPTAASTSKSVVDENQGISCHDFFGLRHPVSTQASAAFVDSQLVIMSRSKTLWCVCFLRVYR